MEIQQMVMDVVVVVQFKPIGLALMVPQQHHRCV